MSQHLSSLVKIVDCLISNKEVASILKRLIQGEIGEFRSALYVKYKASRVTKWETQEWIIEVYL